MPKALLVVESPAKARTLSKYLGKDFVVRATVGHIKDLPTNQLGVAVGRDFQPTLQLIRGKSKVIEAIREAARGASSVFLASDPDREGEAIAWHVADEISRGRKSEDVPPLYRVLLHEITRTGVRKALDAPGELDRKRYESQLARRIVDRLVGYELSPLLWKKVSGGLSAGRVQSVAVALVVDREREIVGFKPQEYWVIKALLDGRLPPQFAAKLVRIDGKKSEIGSSEQAQPLIEALRAARYSVDSVKRDEKQRFAPPPFITSTLQQDAHRILHFSAKKTMQLAQKLYEGVDIGDMGTAGLITYMRTDSLRVSDEAVGAVRDYVRTSFGPQYVPQSPNRFRNRKTAQDAHEAIRPTSMDFSPDKVARYLERDMARLYSLIWNRFVASQMAPAKFDVTVVGITADGRFGLEATGRVQLFDGFLRAFRDVEAEDGDEPALPPLAVGEPLSLARVDGEQNFTQPPPRFTEGTLVKELEKLGIGRPSTYATILSTIEDKSYVDKEKGRFRPTDLGFVVTDLLRENFPKIMDVQFTAQMEEDLDRIEEGDLERVQLLSQFWSGFQELLTTAKANMKSVKKSPEKTELPCPRCGNPLVIRFGKNGSFLACSTFPKCRTTLPFVRGDDGKPVLVQEQKSEEKCEVCGADVVLKSGRFGRFWACVSYPECKFTRPFSTGYKCFREGCNGTLVEKRSKRNSTFYRCSNRDCEAVVFGRIKEGPCPTCGNPFLEEKGRGKEKQLRCPKCGGGQVEAA